MGAGQEVNLTEAMSDLSLKQPRASWVEGEREGHPGSLAPAGRRIYTIEMGKCYLSGPF